MAEITPAGAPTGKEFTLPGEYLGSTCPVVVENEGDAGFYVPRFEFPNLPVRRYAFGPGSGVTDLGETGLVANIDTFQDMRPDPATGDIYIDAKDSAGTVDKLLAVHRTSPFVKSVPFEALGGLKQVHGFDFDASGQTLYVSEGSRIDIFHREPPSAPYGLEAPNVDSIRSQGANAHSGFVAGGAQVSYSFEYGTDTSYGSATPPTKVPFEHFGTKVDAPLVGLQPNTTYHVRLAATNSGGTSYGPDRVFTTYPTPPGGPDPCPNALARKQTGARSLPDCRAYELVSAADTGGYDVESSLVPGQAPFPGFPLATDRLLYATHSGAVPGPWNATNKGPDPYLATRTANGWATDYEGLPADINPAAGSFSSVLGEADSSLSTLAFAGASLCSPCFGSGIRDRDPGPPAEWPAGPGHERLAGRERPRHGQARRQGREVLLPGRVNSSSSPPNTPSSPVPTRAGTSRSMPVTSPPGRPQIVSTDPGGNALTGTVSELDVSADGSRVVTAQTGLGRLRGQRIRPSLPAPGRHAHRRRPRPGHHHRRPLRRHDQRRLQGLLHHRRQTARRRHRHQCRPLRGGGRRRRQPRPLAPHRDQLRRLQPGRELRRRPLEHDRRKRQLRRGRDRRRWGSGLRLAARSTSSAPSRSTAGKAP